MLKKARFPDKLEQLGGYLIDFKQQVLTSGLRVITAPMKETKAVSILFLLGVGSRYEKKEENGISHFLEHLIFKGTKKRPNALALSKELDALGANYNAFTSTEYTGFYVHVSSEHFPQAFDILYDMVFHPLLPEEEIEKEKGVIVEEINMYQDTPQKHIHEVLDFLLYGDTPLGRSIAGTKEAVRSFKRADFENYLSSFYTTDNAVLVVAGGQEIDWSKTIEEYFKGQKSELKRTYEGFQDFQSRPCVKVEYKKTDQAHLGLAVKTYPRTDPRYYQLKIIAKILGGYMSSRLFVSIREKRGLAYYISAQQSSYRDTGDLSIMAGVDLKRVDKVISLIVEELASLKNKPVSQEELRRAKENIKGQLYLSLEESTAVAEFLAEQELLRDRVLHPEELASQIDKVSVEDIQMVCQDIFKTGRLNFALIGPYKESKNFEKLLTI